jgi:acetyl-CoA acyltransferase
VPQGVSAELIAAKWSLSRQQLDEFAAQSHHRAAAAWDEGRFEREVAAIKVPGPDGSLVEVLRDETIRPATSVDVLANLKPAFYSEVWAERFPQIN